ncbi:MAG TPA: thioredoxin family protein [Rudaea sp.]|jgi:thiol-disulfide isomerase/thioredoxin
MKWFLLLVSSLASIGVLAASDDAPKTVDAALAAAAREQRPLLLDFQAQWCYSCYFMATHVLTGPLWQTAARRVRVLEVDADSPDGAQWMKKLAVKALPSYVVLKSDGSELGRIVAEQSSEKFYPVLNRILAGGDVIDVLKAKAQKGSIEATAEVLAGYQARDEFDAGLAWYAQLPAPQRASADANLQVALWRDRLTLGKALHAEDHPACIAAGQKALAGPVGCDRYYVLESLLECSDKLPTTQRKALLENERPALDHLLATQVFTPVPYCADQRTAVMVSADLDKAVGDNPAQKAVLDHAIDFARAALHEDYRGDRNLADNLRVYLTRAGRLDELDALMPKLMAAYPDDYVYAYRYGRSLLDRNRPAEALPYFEQAAQKSFGANRLAVAEQHAKALLALKRRGDAEKVVTEALEQNGPWFAEQAAKLKALLKS